MRGTVSVTVKDSRNSYRFELKRNITILCGDSGRGKTTLFEMVADYNRYGAGSSVKISCDKAVIAVDLLEGKLLKRAGVLLFHHNPEKWIPGSYIKIGYFSSDTELVYQDEIHGSLLSQAEKVVDLIYTKYLKGIVSYEGVVRVETYPYPRVAIREAIFNAIAHKNYASLIPIQIQVFDNKLIISNDCVFPEDWTMDDFLGKHRSRPYNPLIANTFYRAGFIESWGRGIMKIREACEIAGNQEPAYVLKTGELTVVFEAKAAIGDQKPVIEEENPLFEGGKPSIELRKEEFLRLLDGVKMYSTPKEKLMMLFDSYHDAEFFGRKEIKESCAVETSAAGDLLQKLKACKAIEEVSGHGKGKYRFIV